MATINENMFSTPKAKLLLKKYDERIKLAESIRSKKGLEMNFERKLALAQTLENTRKQIRAMEAVDFSGATNPSQVGQYKRYAVDMVTAVVPNLIAYDCVSVQALDNRVGMINYLEFAYGSNKGTAKQGQVFASALGYQGMNEEYTSNRITGESFTVAKDPAGKTVVQTAILAFGPVLKGTVSAYVSPTLKFQDDGNGGLVGTGIETGGTINYDTGEITYKVSDQLDAAETGTIGYSYDNETVPVEAPQMQMKITSLPVTTTSRKLAAIWSFDAAYELEKEYGSSMQSLMATQATAEIAQEIDNEITLDLYRIASAGPEVRWSKVQPTGVNIVDHYDSFWNKVVEGSNQIFDATRRVHANFMICGIGVDNVLKCMRNFDSANDTTSVGPHFVGTLGGMIKCYVNPNYGQDEFVLGYKGPNTLDAGYFYCPLTAEAKAA